eukprot:TRINITY_DN1466_c0_g1_i1.p1 TRINITY_DN1466_c0_g1~~TRINITY_DN1466_c0_g1_i1.p1  ORF type:complete len:918 (+),score=78.21 TRINITY_DN1466_c0_g1_i1:2-2755(+)
MIHYLLLVIINFNIVTSNIYYVSPEGSDSNVGNSTNAPLLTLDRAFGVLRCNDTLFIRQGSYKIVQDLKIALSGCDLPTYISAYPGETVSLVAWTNFTFSDNNTTALSSFSGRTFPFAHYPNGSQLFRISDYDLTSGRKLFNSTDGSYTFYLNVSFGFSWNPDTQLLRLSIPKSILPRDILFAAPVSVIVDVPNVVISGLRFTGFGQAALVTLGKNTTVKNNTFDTCFISLSTSSNTTIEWNTFVFEGRDDATLRTSVVQYYTRYPSLWEVGYGIYNLYPYSTYGYLWGSFIHSKDVQYLDVRYNHFSKGLSGIRMENWNHSIIHNNKFDDMFAYDAFFDYSYLSSSYNVSIYKNLFKNSHTSTLVTSQRYNADQKIYVSRNVFHVPPMNIEYFSMWNVWTNIFILNPNPVNFFHNLVLMGETAIFPPVQQNFDPPPGNILYNSYNNIYIQWEVVLPNISYYNSNVVVNAYSKSALCSNPEFNSTNTCIFTDGIIVFENLTDGRYGIVQDNNVTIDKGSVIPGWTDVNGPSVGLPDVGPFESNQHPDGDWPFSDPITDCVWGEWSAWSLCDCNITARIRSVFILNNALGKPCDGLRIESTSCITTSCSTTNCSWSEWSSWSLCNCSTTTRQRTIAQNNGIRGFPCDGPFNETISCSSSICESSTNFTIFGINNYTSTTTQIANTTVNIQNVSTFVSEATNITNSSVSISNTNSTFLANTITSSNITLNTHSSITSYSNNITSSTISATDSNVELFSNNISSSMINLTESTLHYQRNVILTSNSVVFSQDSNISVSGNLTIDPSSQLSLDENSLVQISGCLDANKIVITPSVHRQQNLQNINTYALIETTCFSSEVQIVNEKNEVCKKRIETKLSTLLLYVNYNECGTSQIGSGTSTTSVLSTLAFLIVLMFGLTGEL